MQSLIKQCNEANSKVNFLFKKDDVEKQNALATKICGVNVEKKLKPIKTVVATASINHEIRTAIDNMLHSMVFFCIGKGIYNRNVFYAIQKAIYAFHTAVSALETWTTSDAQDALNMFTEYRKKNIEEEIIELRRIEKEKDIAELKDDMYACEDAIEDIAEDIMPLLDKIRFVVEVIVPFEILKEEMPIITEDPEFQIDENEFKSKPHHLSRKQVAQIGIVLIIGAVLVYFIIKIALTI